VDQGSLDRIEFQQVVAAIAAHARSEAGRMRLLAWRPFTERGDRDREIERLREAIRRAAEPGAWCSVGLTALYPLIGPTARERLDGPALVHVRSWLDAAAATHAAWNEGSLAERFPALASLVATLRVPPGLGERLAMAFDADGHVVDGASPALKRLRAEGAEGARRLEQQLERWAREFGADAYVTRHGERFVAMVPADGFPRRRGIVHDSSHSGRSLLVEPFESCVANNRLIEVRAAAADEERRIVAELAAAVLAAADDLLALEATLVHLDTLFARAEWAREVDGRALAPSGERLKLVEARHPLLALKHHRDPAKAVVPLDLELGGRSGGRVLLVSGPNMGGKTVLLKTVGLTVALSHAALPVPAAEGSLVPEVGSLLVDLGDPQSLEQGLSTFAAHLAVLARMAEIAAPDALLLCDELGAGTDPEEGAALARALVEHFARRQALGIVTTHLGILKRMSGEVEGVVNGSLEFDPDTLEPRYRFLGGVPGASHALSVAERLGFPAALLERARTLTPESARALERLTAELGDAVRRARAESASLGEARQAAAAEAERHAAAVEESRRELAVERRRLTRESEALLARCRELWQVIQREARRDARTRDPGSMKAELSETQRALEALAGPEPGGSTAPLASDQLIPGLRVRVMDLDLEADVVSAPDAEGRVRLKRGGWSIESRVGRLAAARDSAAPAARPIQGSWALSEESVPLEVDVRGLDVGDALAALDGGLDRVVMAGMRELRVIHGVGRGVLRAAVERHLRQHPQVEEQRLAHVGEGGRGVTVVRLRA